ncbi:mitochondrial ATPase inhibitor, IATP domain-containing protein [Phthorimaea operculella]|nr:mitochondrial ATPase inhibitor, IATP domain-containing protein [Phthorimaea operculella]
MNNFVKLRDYSYRSGAGKGGGHGGAIREAGGAIGRYGAAQEEGYFYNKSKEDIEKMREKMKEDEKRKQKKDDDE